MGDVAVLETAQHMDDGIDLADIGEELVAEAAPLLASGKPEEFMTKVALLTRDAA